MAKHRNNGVGFDSHNIPPGELGDLEQGFPKSNDNDVSIGPLLKRNSDAEDRATGRRR